VILRIDARTLIPSDYIEKCVLTLLETRADNVGGVQKPLVRFPAEGKPAEGNGKENSPVLTQLAVGIALGHFFSMGGAQFRVGKRSGLVDTVYLGCFRKEIFERLSLFDDEAAVISEDSDMNYRIRQSGGRVYLNKDIQAYYYPRDNFKDLWRLYYRYGGAKAGNFLKHKILAWRQFVPPVFLLGILLLPILSIFQGTFLYYWILLLGAYAMADFIVSSKLALASRISDFLRPSIQQSISPNPKLSRLSLFWRLL